MGLMLHLGCCCLNLPSDTEAHRHSAWDAYLGPNQHLSGSHPLPLPSRHPSQVSVSHHSIHTILDAQKANYDFSFHACAADLLKQTLKLSLICGVL